MAKTKLLTVIPAFNFEATFPVWNKSKINLTLFHQNYEIYHRLPLKPPALRLHNSIIIMLFNVLYTIFQKFTISMIFLLE